MSHHRRLRALVTGANRGIGRELVRQLREKGYQVILSARDLDKTQLAAVEIGGGVEAIELDVADSESIARGSSEVLRRFGGVDILVNNAGIHYDSWERATNADWTVIREAFETNVFGAWRLAQLLAEPMRRQGWGRIVNVSSEAGSLASMGGGTPAYSASKAALNAVTRSLASELRPHGVLVNSVCPGWTATDMGGGGRPVSEGAASVLWAALLPDDGPSGGFFRDGRSLPW